MVIKTKETSEVYNGIEPKFRDPSTLSEAQLTDPDYNMKMLAIEAGRDPNGMLICSKCHHCR